MKQVTIVLLFIFLLSNGYAQEKIEEFSFTSFGMRGSGESIIIRQDTTTYTTSHGGVKNEDKYILTSKETWDRLMKSISQYSLKALENLPSPTNYREGDGASYSGIIISTNQKKYHCGMFDNYNPNEKLKVLLSIMLESRK